MNRNNLLNHLAEVKRVAEQGEERIARQMEIISRFENLGQNVTEARRLLGNYKILQQVRFAEMDNLLDRLDTDAA